MRRPGLAPLLLLSLASIAASPKVVLVGKERVEVGHPIVLDASRSTFDAKYPPAWSYRGPAVPLLYLHRKGAPEVTVFIPEAVAGIYEFKLKLKGVPEGQTEVDVDVEVFTVTVGDAPTPTPTPEPTPAPTPTPPTPPVPVPVSEVTDKLRVLVLYETSEWLSINQYEVLRSDDVRSYLNAHTMDDGTTKAWRFWDKDTVASGETPGWQAALATARAKLGTAATAAPFTPTMFAFKDTVLLDSEPIKDLATTNQFMRRFGGR